MLLFFCDREWMRYRVRKPRFAPLHTATAPLFTLHILVMPFVAFRSLYIQTTQRRGYPPLPTKKKP